MKLVRNLAAHFARFRSNNSRLLEAQMLKEDAFIGV